MSVSDTNVSWSTMSYRRSVRSSNPSSSTCLSSCKRSDSSSRHAIRPVCVSAKNSGMRHSSWREPKPLKSRCNSATVSEQPDHPKGAGDKHKTAPRKVERESTSDVNESIDRLSQPTTSSKWKSTKNRPRDVGIDMNCYSWSRMNAYKDYQRVLYKDNGTMKKAIRGKER